MDLSWLSDPAAWLGLLTLIILEIVLGIDNLIFVAILAEKLPPEQRDRARIVGLSLALVMRLILLASISWLVTLTTPLFSVWGQSFAGRDLIMLCGGVFLLFKATTELHERLEGVEHVKGGAQRAYAAFATVVAQILVLDAVFSIDSVITAIGMSEHLPVMMLAVVIAMVLMIAASKPLTTFVNAHPTVVMLCLGFLLMIGFSLIAEGFGFHIPKGYLYAAIGFSVLIEAFNQVSQANRIRYLNRTQSFRERTANTVLSLMGSRLTAASADEAKPEAGPQPVEDTAFGQNERAMIHSVLTLAERPIRVIATPRADIHRLDLSQPEASQRKALRDSPYSRLVVIRDGSIDEPLGIVARKDLLAQLLDGRPLDIDAALRQPLVLPETVTVLKALESFRQHAADMAFVVNEFGSLEGIVTQKDLMEAIAGEFPEEHERHELPAIVVQPDGSYDVEGSLELVTLEQYLTLGDFEDEDFHTVAGLLMDCLERIPREGDEVTVGEWKLRVTAQKGNRTERVLISPLADGFDAAI
ncbi:TerC family protein [Chromobacterium violaceum]|uniref:Magnesium/cobalt efflux protein CorC n=3 Tax=Chromobacterium violaceum TaxID=536 RepID=A0A1R0MX64_CHRVL|nr:TerC family protein [Chromobacterium violaceum]AAQ62048.1 probable transport membrane protein [Chromobacterium violaceum ATCC 12472]ATP30548.1 TerC family protein [Chromobacterium violaceum]ATP34457.1 TerC family protein [Chromobacterium violaceum]KJH69253.1 membrane protein [Chromobacterium violaceum]KMN51556.1 membrane protein [Chromobacterium violaceum]